MVQKHAVELARRARQAGHRGHPDARVDDHDAPPDPRRGVRLRQRRARRRGRRDAVRRDERGQVPARDRPDDGAHHRDHRGPGPGADRRRSAPGRRTKGGAITYAAATVGDLLDVSVPRRLHPERRLRPPACPGCARGSRCWRSPPTRPSARSWRSAGASRRSSPSRSRTPTTWSSRSTRRCCRSGAAQTGRAGRHRGRLAARDPRVAQRDARAPDGRRRRRPGPGVQVAVSPHGELSPPCIASDRTAGSDHRPMPDRFA